MRVSTPEEKAREKIDALLEAAGWIVLDKKDFNRNAGPGVALREAGVGGGEADYLLFVAGKAAGVIEAKPAGTTLSGVAEQSESYMGELPPFYQTWSDPRLARAQQRQRRNRRRSPPPHSRDPPRSLGAACYGQEIHGASPPEVTAAIDLPPQWTWATVDQLASLVQYGSSAKCGEEADGVAVLRMGNIVDGEIDATELRYLPTDHPEFPDLLLLPGDLLFNRTNSAELVGKTAVYDGRFDACSFASYLIRVRLTGCEPRLVSFFINSVYGRLWVRSVVSQQVGQANVNGSKLRAVAIPVPPLAEQKVLLERAEGLLMAGESLARDVGGVATRVASERQSILRAAFAGKLVPQDPADVPAAKLLERIAAERAAVGPGPRPARRRDPKRLAAPPAARR